MNNPSPRKVSRQNPAVKAALKATFPDYTGRKVTEDYSGPRRFDLYTSGGTWDDVVVIDAATMRVATLEPVGGPWNNRAAFEPIDQPAGTILAVRHHFCGQVMGVALIVRQPETGLLEDGAVALIGAGE